MEFTGSRSSAAQQFMDPLDIAAVRPDHEYAPIRALQLYIRDSDPDDSIQLSRQL